MFFLVNLGSNDIYETVVPGDGKNEPKRRVFRRLGIK